MPTREDEEHGRARGKAGGRGVCPPVPHVLAVGLGVGLGAVLDGVVDDHHVGGSAGHTGLYADGQHAAFVAGQPPLGHRAVVACDDEADVGGAGDAVADGAAVAVRQGLGIGRRDDALFGVLGERPDGEVVGRPHRFALLGRHADDEPGVRGVEGPHESRVDEVERGACAVLAFDARPARPASPIAAWASRTPGP